MKRAFFVFVLLGLIFTAGSLHAQVNSGSIIEVSASLNKSSYKVGEPIFLNFEFKNTTTRLVEFRTRLSFHYGDIKLLIQKPESLPLNYKGIFQSSFYPYYLYKIPPGDTERVTFTILYEEESQDGLVFSKPMEAKISLGLDALVGNKKEFYRFPAMEVQINKPEGKDLKALSELRKKSLVKDIHRGRSSPENHEFLESFLKKYPDSFYYPYILYALGNGYTWKTEEFEPDRKKAIELFKKFIEMYPSHILTDDAIYKIGHCYDGLNDKETANRWFVKLYNEYPESNRINHPDMMMRKYIYQEPDELTMPSEWMLYKHQNDQGLW